MTFTPLRQGGRRLLKASEIERSFEAVAESIERILGAALQSDGEQQVRATLHFRTLVVWLGASTMMQERQFIVRSYDLVRRLIKTSARL